MKKIVIIFFCFVVLGLNSQTNCSLSVSPANSTIACGQSVQLNATGSGGPVLMHNDFNDGTAGVGWSVSAAAQFDNPCGPSLDGTTHMWMGSTTAAPRTMTTIPYNIACTGTICFDLKFSETFNSPCEEPDLSTEGVALQYSTDGGTTWNQITYFDPMTGLYYQWSNYCFPIPPGAVSPNTMFSWIQTESSGNDFDHWGIDNVDITLSGACAPNPYFFNWQPSTGLNTSTTGNPIASPTTSTTYTVYYTNNIDDTCIATVNITVNSPTADAGPTQTICAGQSVTLSGSGNSTSATTTTVPFNSTGSTSILDNTTATNQITVSGLPYSTISTTSIMEVCLDISHTWDSDVDIFLVCPGGIQLELSTDNGSSSDNYTQTCFKPTATTNITSGTSPFTGSFLPEGNFSTLNGCTANGNWVLQVGDDAGGDEGILNNWHITFNVPTQSPPSWSPNVNMTGSNTFTPTVSPTTTTQYTLTVSNDGVCPVTDTVTVFVAQPQPLILNNTSPICEGGTATLSASPVIAGAVYTWLPGGETAPTITVSPNVTTTYSCSYAIGSCVSPSYTTTVQVAGASSLSVTPATICAGTSTTLTVSGANTYTWLPSTGLNTTIGSTVIANPTSTTTYSITGTTNLGCQGTTEVIVTVNPLPNVDAGTNTSICEGNSITLNATNADTYSWAANPSLSSTTIANPVATPTTTTTYTVTGTSIDGCTATDVVTISILPPLSIAGIPSNTFCEGNSTTISVTATGGNNNYDFSWLPTTGVNLLTINGSSAQVAPPTTTTYTITATDNCSATSVSTTFTITINPKPILNINPVTSGCQPLEVDFSATSNPPCSICNWDFDGNGTSTSCDPSPRIFPIADRYNVIYRATDNIGCSNSDTVTFDVYPVPNAMFLSTPQPTTIIDPEITFTDITNGNIASRTWFFYEDSLSTTSSLTMPSYTYSSPGDYPVKLTVITDKGCKDTVIQTVTISEYFVIYVPNAFTPNGNGQNDIFNAYGTGIEKFNMKIYNRWGEKIFETNELTDGWNGKGTNGTVEEGIYIYKIEVINFLDQKKVLHGQVNVVR